MSKKKPAPVLTLAIAGVNPIPSVPDPDGQVQATVTRLRTLRATIETATADATLVSADLAQRATVVYRAELRAGRAPTSVAIGDGKVVFRESWKAIDAVNADPLRAAFGDAFPALFREAESVKLRKGVSVADIQKAAGRAWGAVSALLDVATTIEPVEGFSAATAAMFADERVDLAEAALSVSDQARNAPQVRTA
jgi:hypothetical protein